MAKIVLVDDHDIFRNGLKAVISQTPELKVVADYNNGGDFLINLENIAVDLLLLDIQMPGMNGIQVAEKVKERKPEVKILILSMFDDYEYYQKLTEIGVEGFILKDAPFQELNKAILKILDNENFFSQALLLKLLTNKSKTVNLDLTSREEETLKLIVEGYTASEIATKLNISFRTVERHRSNLFYKTNTNNSLKLVVFAIKNGLVNI